MRPFVYVAGLIRTGSTALSEALSAPGLAFVAREPRLGTNRFSLRRPDIEALAAYGIDADAALAWPRAVARGLRGLGFGGHPEYGGSGRGPLGGYAARAFREKIVEPLAGHVQQVGVKEVRHDGWEHVLAAFPGTRVVAIARDPRDVYLSQRVRVLKRGNPLPSPEAFADKIAPQFEQQRALLAASGGMAIRYEDMCLDPSVLARVRAYVQSPVEGAGSLGAFTGAHPLRKGESALHGGDLTDRRVGRWRRETDPAALAEAQRVFERLSAYTSYWNYGPDGPLPDPPRA